VGDIFELRNEDKSVKFSVPTMEEVRCFLNRQSVSFVGREAEEDAEIDFEGYYDDDTEYDDLDFEAEEVDVEEMTDADAWMVAGLFGVGQHSPSWWLNSKTEHGEECLCRPAGLLEVLQDYAASGDRQGALEAHLGALRDVWDHFWSGDALVNGEGELINGACPACLIEGREHLSEILDEARNLAEELGEALAAFHSHIDLGIDRY